MKILITGATGKIGSSLAKNLNSKHDLVLLSRSQKKQPGAKSYSVDINAKDQIAQVLDKEKPAAVIHLAGLLAEDCARDEDQAYKVNVVATKDLALLSKEFGVERFIFASSSAIYNQAKLEPTNEQSNIGPSGVYAKTKLLAEEQLQSVAQARSTKFISLRLFNVYGPAFDDSLVYKLVHSSKTKPALLFGPDNFYRDYIHISDVISVFCKCLDVESPKYDVFNIASGRVRNNTQVIKELKGKGLKLYFETKERPASFSWADISKAKRALDFNPSEELNINDGAE